MIRALISNTNRITRESSRLRGFADFACEFFDRQRIGVSPCACRSEGKGRIMIDVSDCNVDWKRKAGLQEWTSSRERFLVSEGMYGGTVDGAVRFFKSLPQDQQERIEMFVDSGVIEGLEEETLVGADLLRVLASRQDLPCD
jgi:hypothetical protein